MVTRQDSKNWTLAKVGQYLTVNTNPYGSQCVVLPDQQSRWATGKQMSYTNAIDLLGRASGNGYTVHAYGDGYAPKTGDVFVIRANGHIYGHTGILVEDFNGSTFETVETNVDGNADSLSIGGPARRKTRLVRGNALVDASTGYIIGWQVGTYSLPFNQESAAGAVSQPKKTKKETKNTMFGSFAFSVKEGDHEFIKGAIYFYNAQTNVVTGITSNGQLTQIRKWYKDKTGEDLPLETFSTQAPVHREIFAGLQTETHGNYRLYNNIKQQLTEIANKLGNKTIAEQLADIKTDTPEANATLAAETKGTDIANQQKFKATVTLNIRKAASTKAEIVGTLAKGDTVDIVGSAVADGYYWISFKRSGQLVYVASKVQGGDKYGEVFS